MFTIECFIDVRGTDVREHVVLVGGFSASEWLVAKVDAALKSHGLRVVRPDGSPVYAFKNTVSVAEIIFTCLSEIRRSRMVLCPFT